MNSTQLDLWQEELDALPWSGRSPRALTSDQMSLFLLREPQKDACFFIDPNQAEMWPTVKKAPRDTSRGASLLVPLKEVDHAPW